MKINYFILIYLIFQSTSVVADKYGLDDPTEEFVSVPWFPIYFIVGLWLFLKGPLKKWGNKNPGLSIFLFIFVIPAILGFLLR